MMYASWLDKHVLHCVCIMWMDTLLEAEEDTEHC